MAEGMVFRDLDRAALDAAYDNQRHVPDFRESLSQYTALSAAARTELECRRGVPYGAGPRQQLDIFPARGAGVGLAPVHVFFHGGAWRNLHRDDAAAQAPAMVAAGVAFVAAGFDLATEVSLDAMVFQARMAVAWVAVHAREFGADPARLTVSGHSSGAHMAAMVAVTDWPGLFDLPADLVRGAMLVSGLFELEPVRLSYRNALLKLDEGAVARLSPIRHRPRAGTYVVLAMAEHETGEFHRQSRELASAWTTPPVIVGAGRHHYDVAFDLADAGRAIGAACLEMARG